MYIYMYDMTTPIDSILDQVSMAIFAHVTLRCVFQIWASLWKIAKRQAINCRSWLSVPDKGEIYEFYKVVPHT